MTARHLPVSDRARQRLAETEALRESGVPLQEACALAGWTASTYHGTRWRLGLTRPVPARVEALRRAVERVRGGERLRAAAAHEGVKYGALRSAVKRAGVARLRLTDEEIRAAHADAVQRGLAMAAAAIGRHPDSLREAFARLGLPNIRSTSQDRERRRERFRGIPLTSEQRSRHSRESQARLTPEERRANSLRAAETRRFRKLAANDPRERARRMERLAREAAAEVAAERAALDRRTG
jgi:hypothetical protein